MAILNTEQIAWKMSSALLGEQIPSPSAPPDYWDSTTCMLLSSAMTAAPKWPSRPEASEYIHTMADVDRTVSALPLAITRSDPTSISVKGSTRHGGRGRVDCL